MEFLDNKYTQWYLSIIERGKNRTLEGYVEKHHIIPASMGGIDVVKLTAREHFICHLLLTKMTAGKDKSKMIRAAMALANYRSKNRLVDVKVTSRVYQTLKEQFSAMMKGPRSEETRKKMSESAKKRIRQPLSEEHKQAIARGRTGKTHNEETRKKISKSTNGRVISEPQRIKQSKSTKGRKLVGDRLESLVARNKKRIGTNHSEETKKKISEANKGRTPKLGFKLSEETKKKISEANKGRKRSPEHIEALAIGRQKAKVLREFLRVNNRNNISETLLH